MIGMNDLECPGNYFGPECNLRCQKCAGNGKCSKRYGICIDGCILGYGGIWCEKKCPDACGGDGSCIKSNLFCNEGCKPGYTGFTCENKCPDNCGGDGSCLKITSFCLNGCKTGYTGPECTIKDSKTPTVNECTNCLQSCGSNGECVYGCVTGFYGLYCNLVCACPLGIPCQQTGGSCINQRGNFTPSAAPDVTMTTPSSKLLYFLRFIPVQI